MVSVTVTFTTAAVASSGTPATPATGRSRVEPAPSGTPMARGAGTGPNRVSSTRVGETATKPDPDGQVSVASSVTVVPVVVVTSADPPWVGEPPDQTVGQRPRLSWNRTW